MQICTLKCHAPQVGLGSENQNYIGLMWRLDGQHKFIFHNAKPLLLALIGEGCWLQIICCVLHILEQGDSKLDGRFTAKKKHIFKQIKNVIFLC